MNDNSGNNILEKNETVAPPNASEMNPRKCRLSLFSAISFLLIIPLYISGIFIENNKQFQNFLLPVILAIAAFSVIGSPIMAMIAKIRIALSDGRLKGEKAANLVIVGSSILLLVGGIMPTLGRVKSIAQRVVCGTNLKGLGTAMIVYANDNNGKLPTASKWCDLLITHADVSPKSFICPSSNDVHGECSYALNKYAAGKYLNELPAGMILIFETNIGRSENERDNLLKNRDFVKQTPDAADRNPDKHKIHKERWNQVGGPENLMNAHKEGANFTFSDGHMSYKKFRYPDRISDSDLMILRWDEKKTQFSASDYLSVSEIYGIKKKEPIPNSVIILGVAIIVMGLIIIVISQAWKHSLFAFSIAIGASAVGFIFGSWTNTLYRPAYYEWFAGSGGTGIGFIVGICYAGILMKLQCRLKHSKSISQLASSLGIIAGAICSTLLHLALSIIHQKAPGFGFMLVGLPFGIAGGAILGMISGWIITNRIRSEVTEP